MGMWCKCWPFPKHDKKTQTLWSESLCRMFTTITEKNEMKNLNPCVPVEQLMRPIAESLKGS